MEDALKTLARLRVGKYFFAQFFSCECTVRIQDLWPKGLYHFAQTGCSGLDHLPGQFVGTHHTIVEGAQDLRHCAFAGANSPGKSYPYGLDLLQTSTFLADKFLRKTIGGKCLKALKFLANIFCSKSSQWAEWRKCI